jgi:hypothetical protein
MENIFGKFLEEYSFVSDVTDDNLVFDQVHVGTVAEFLFELGSNVDTQERYRKALYDMHKTYMKRLKKVGKDVMMGEESSCDLEEETGRDEETDSHDLVNEAESNANKRKREAGREDEKLSEAPEMTSLMETDGRASEKRKKSKRKREPHPEPVVESLNVEEEDTNATEKKKAKKKKKKKRKSSVSKDDGDKDDEVITISYSEQKKAAEIVAETDEKESSLKKYKEEKKKSKKMPEKTPEKSSKEIELTSEQKRVRFGRTNHSKSHTASMKALKTMEQPELKSPGRGILRSKSPSGKGQLEADSSSKAKSRKRAMNYF